MTRGLMRASASPASGATTTGIAVQGKTRRPAWKGSRPCTTWKNCASRKIEPERPEQHQEQPLVRDDRRSTAEQSERKHRLSLRAIPNR